MNLKVINFSGIPFAFFQVALISSTCCFSPKFEHLFSTETSVARTVMLFTNGEEIFLPFWRFSFRANKYLIIRDTFNSPITYGCITRQRNSPFQGAFIVLVYSPLGKFFQHECLSMRIVASFSKQSSEGFGWWRTKLVFVRRSLSVERTIHFVLIAFCYCQIKQRPLAESFLQRQMFGCCQRAPL